MIMAAHRSHRHKKAGDQKLFGDRIMPKKQRTFAW